MNESKFILELIKKKEELTNKLNEDIKLLLEKHNEKLDQLIQKAETKTTTNTDPQQFINEILQYREFNKDNNIDDWRLNDKVNASELYERYNEWCIQNNKANITRTKFGRCIRPLLPKSRTKKGIFYSF